MGQTTEITYRYRWVILGVLWITYIVVFLNRLSVGPLAPFLKEDLSINSTQIGLIMAASSFGYMLTLLPTGWVVDKIGARWPMAIGELMAGVSMIALFFVPSYIGLLVLMFVTGIGCGFLLPSTTQGVIVWFPLRERATIMGLKQTAVNMGGHHHCCYATCCGHCPELALWLPISGHYGHSHRGCGTYLL